ncbi:MAG: hypothetical protein IJK22_09335 [Bacteroidales bacterium]|nr:hypothetical protein [Bacteroidales bacterium]
MKTLDKGVLELYLCSILGAAAFLPQKVARNGDTPTNRQHNSCYIEEQGVSQIIINQANTPLTTFYEKVIILGNKST